MSNMYDKTKTENAIAYIMKKDGENGLFSILAIADLLHREKYGRLITGDTWIVNNGQRLPSATVSVGMLSLTAAVRDGRFTIDYDEFSESDLITLDAAIAIYRQYVLGGK